MQEMYKGLINSPETTITNSISNSDTTIYVLDPTRVPIELPNLMTLGTGTNAETVKVISIEGNILTVERGFQGAPMIWNTGTIIARNFTEYDYEALRKNLIDIDGSKEALLKNAPVKIEATDADTMPLTDSASSTTKKITFATIKTTLKKYFDTLYNKTTIENNLTTTTPGSALDATQGKVLDGKISEVNTGLNEEISERKGAMWNPNLLINGGFDIWQRGTEFIDVANVYTADVWNLYGRMGSAYKINFDENNYGIRVIKKNEDSVIGNTESDTIMCQPLENYKKFLDKSLTLSFWAKGYNGATLIFCNIGNDNDTFELSNTWKQYTFTTPSFAIHNENHLHLKGVALSSRCRASQGFEIAQVKLEFGDTATKFIPQNYGTELVKCQRYYEVSDLSLADLGNEISIVLPAPNDSIVVGRSFKVTKRIPPTIQIMSINGTPNKMTLSSGADSAQTVELVQRVGLDGFRQIIMSGVLPESVMTYKYIASAEL